ncbi:MAG TPA: histidine kinase [Casimicrobiaceae bacterium]|nr:histidine kinase [Casimicrobiaceae bacterium]
MTAIASPRSIFRVSWLAASILSAAWRGIAAEHVRATLLFGVLVSAVHFIGSQVGLRDYGIGDALRTVLTDQLGAFSIMLAVVVADQITADDGQRRLPYILAVIAGAAVWAVVEYAGFRVLGMDIRWYSVENRYTSAAEFAWRTAYGFLEWLLLGGAATFIVLDARRARVEQRRLRNAQSERARTAKRMLESQLQALQARVEPQFLFNTMAQVRRLYDVDTRLAERVLDDLIAYLRTAMPQMRDTTSTVAREMELARAYLDIVKVTLGDRLRVEFAISGESARGRMPPMMLLPLIDHAIARGLDAPASRQTLRISSEVAAGRLRIRIADSASQFAALEVGDDISSIRERLIALYGDRAELQLTCEHESSSRATMEMPFEAAEDGGEGVDPAVAVRADSVS